VQYLGASGATAFTGALVVGANIIRTVVTAQDGVTSKTYTVTVTRATACAPKLCQTITFPRPANMLTTSADQLLSATSTSGLTVVFQTYAPALCSVTGTPGNQYVHVIPAGTPQTCVINAMQGGNATYAAAPWVQVGFNINKVAQTITFNQPSSMKRSDPDQVLTATSTSGLSVSFSSYTPSICTVVGTSIHPVTATTNQYCVIAANQSGNDIYAGAIPVTKSLYISPTATGQYQLGDVGPGGGRIFYVSPTAFAESGAACANSCHYLEAAPTTGTRAWVNSNYGWSGNVNTLIGTTRTAIGAGFSNTLAIVGQSGGGSTENKAATVSRAYRGPNNLTDWFLPSKDELKALYDNRAYVPGAPGFYIWSSSEATSTTAWRQYFYFDAQETDGKRYTEGAAVLPIRAF